MLLHIVKYIHITDVLYLKSQCLNVVEKLYDPCFIKIEKNDIVMILSKNYSFR